VTDLALRRVTGDDFDAFFDFVQFTFHDDAEQAARDAERWIFEADRSIGLYDGDRQVGAAAALTRDLTVPGGPIPVACVTAVAVAATHTRRGLLTRMMRHQLTDLHTERREPVAALWASESGIYGRFGYGVATEHARLRTSTREVRLTRPVPPANRRIRLSPAADPKARAEVAAVYDRARTTAVGHLDRRDRWWDYRLRDATPPRFNVALHDGDDGPDGYAVYAIRQQWTNLGPQSELVLHELVTESPHAHDALWSYLFGVDLVAEISWRISPADAPLRQLVDHRSRITVDIGPNLWVRLVDVGRALAARRYTTDVDVVFDVTDALCPWNAGRWRLVAGPDTARCERTDSPADLELSVTELGAAYLGGTTLASLAATSAVRELRRGALRATSVAFAEPRPPYCPEVF
jgi:predicted acetyltransferase